MGPWRLWALALACSACGSKAVAPAKPPPAAPPPKPAAVVEVPDLSPVAAPAGLFSVGRLKRPTTLADTVGKWAGLPVSVRDVIPLAAKDLANVIAWDAPVEFAAQVAPGGKRGGVEAALSLGLTGTEGAVGAARQQGFELKRIAPETYVFAPYPHVKCAIAPAVGSAAARLVCASRESELEDMLPYVTRGLPNQVLGEQDLELELRVEPLRQRFASELGSARLFAGFVVRELSIDSPRFDTAVSDAAYALADELVALVHDADTVRLEGKLDDERRESDLVLTVALRDHKSWTANVIGDTTRKPGPAPDSFFTLPADAGEGGYSVSRDPHLFDGLRRSLLEITDAYLEHEKVGKATRERATRVIRSYLALDDAAVHAQGRGFIALGPRDKAPAGNAFSGWTLLRTTAAPDMLKAPADLAAVLGARDFRAALARTLKVEDKSLPTARVVPLTGTGVPRGAQAVMLKGPQRITSLVAGAFGVKDKDAGDGGTIEVALGAVAVPKSTEMLLGYAPNAKELAARFAQALSPKATTLASNAALEPMRHFNAVSAGYTTLANALEDMLEKHGGSASTAGLPHHGSAPIFVELRTEPGAAPKGIARITVPPGVLEDLPGLVPLLLGPESPAH